MKMRAALVASAMIAGGLAGMADAATKVCNLIVDVKGDTTFGGAVPLTAPTLDITGGDVASDGKRVTGVIRLAALGTEPMAPLGQTYNVSWAVPGGSNRLFLSYLKTPNAETFTYGFVNGTLNSGLGAAKGSINVAKKEITISAPASGWSAYGKITKGTKFSAIEAASAQYNGVYVDEETYAGGTPRIDSAASTKTYTAGAGSCVKVS